MATKKVRGAKKAVLTQSRKTTKALALKSSQGAHNKSAIVNRGRRSSSEGQIMIRVSRTNSRAKHFGAVAGEAAIGSISDWWNSVGAEDSGHATGLRLQPAWPLKEWLAERYEKLFLKKKQLVDSISGPRVYISSRMVERSFLWLAFALLTGAVFIAIFAEVFSIIRIIIYK